MNKVKFIAAVLIIAAFLCGFIYAGTLASAKSNDLGFYSKEMHVISNPHDGLITAMDNDGNVFEFHGDGFYRADVIKVVFHDNDTPRFEDDVIVTAWVVKPAL